MTDIDFESVRRIRESYSDAPETKLDALRALDKRVKRPAKIFAYIFGAVGSIVLGIGMCLAMNIIGNMMPLGIAIGVFGIAIVSACYPIYERILRSRKAKYKDEILALSDEILN